MVNDILLLFSFFGLTPAICGILVLYKYIHSKKFDFAFVRTFFVSFSATWIVVEIILKNLFKIGRPPDPLILQGLSVCPSNFSFPSGHASTAFAGAIVFAHFDKKRAWLYYSIACMIAFSRVALGCHYSLDVIVGSALGIIIAYGTIQFLPKKVTRDTGVSSAR